MRTSLSKDEAALLERLDGVLRSRNRSVKLSEDICDQLVSMARSILSAPNDLSSVVGPVCSTGRVTSWLGVSRQAVHRAVRDGRILAVQSSDGKWFYPTWQFSRNVFASSPLRQCIGRLSNGLSPVQVASWFVTPCGGLDGLRPCDWIEQDRDLSVLLSAARLAARSSSGESDSALHSASVSTSFSVG